MDPQGNPGFQLPPDAGIHTCAQSVNCLTVGQLCVFSAVQETGPRGEMEYFPPEREQVAGLRPGGEQGLYFRLSIQHRVSMAGSIPRRRWAWGAIGVCASH